ncbi:Tim44 domain-containing protein [Aquipseudomonas alcaligenes]|uniref:TIM44-like domain-containing protein n=2 Tax=Aquipseudomonas alcaligenes TaxID=43263 RepID=A0AB73HY47_AQUAC|nr:TIM44-like domain-containing protein [Pseudomonas alcaligenes]MDH0142747.1 TIM44-like domain-containing protein [Pseudomonas alcaligenes]
MQRFLSIALALCLGLTLSLDASAGKRMGGGKSFGSAPTHQTRQADAPTSAAQPAAAGTAGTAATAAAGRAAPAASGASRWLGPLAGIAAGGLLAAMFMGDGFEGIQFLDILLLGLIAFVIFKLFAARRQAQGQPAMAGGMQRQMPQQAPIFGGTSTSAAATINAPAWFDEQRFIEAGRTHFLALQQHWDAAEMDKIAEFVTPQMLSFLKEERASMGEGYQSTYIDDLSVQLDGIDELADKTVATLTFRGVAKTSRFDQGEPFSESWRMERVNGDNQPWLVAGIRQNG